MACLGGVAPTTVTWDVPSSPGLGAGAPVAIVGAAVGRTDMDIEIHSFVGALPRDSGPVSILIHSEALQRAVAPPTAKVIHLVAIRASRCAATEPRAVAAVPMLSWAELWCPGKTRATIGDIELQARLRGVAPPADSWSPLLAVRVEARRAIHELPAVRWALVGPKWVLGPAMAASLLLSKTRSASTLNLGRVSGWVQVHTAVCRAAPPTRFVTRLAGTGSALSRLGAHTGASTFREPAALTALGVPWPVGSRRHNTLAG